METNLHALQKRDSTNPSLQRYAEVAKLLVNSNDAKPEDGVAWIRKLVTDLQIPPLRTYGVTGENTSELVGKARNASSMKANPIALTDEELAAILEAAL